MHRCERGIEDKTKHDFQQMLARIDKEHPRFETNVKPEPQNPKEYLYLVENNLRKVIKTRYQKVFKGKWIEQIKLTIGEKAFLDAEQIMQNRGVTSYEEILNYTQLKDIHQLINSEWDTIHDYFSCSKKEYNKLMAGILQSRTEDAHNRPEHLWPPIERDRAKVLCHDLLKQIKKEV